MKKRVSISTLDKMKAAGQKFVMITAYDATFARLASEAGAETILVGDSLGMVLQGHETTVPVSLDAMVYQNAPSFFYQFFSHLFASLHNSYCLFL